MATLDDVKAGVQAVRDAAAAEKVQVQEKLDAVSAQISDLAAQLSAGVTPEQLDAVVSDLNAAASDIQNIFVPEAPAEAPVEAPVEEAPAEVPAEVPTEEAPAQPLLP